MNIDEINPHGFPNRSYIANLSAEETKTEIKENEDKNHPADIAGPIKDEVETITEEEVVKLSQKEREEKLEKILNRFKKVKAKIKNLEKELEEAKENNQTDKQKSMESELKIARAGLKIAKFTLSSFLPIALVTPGSYNPKAYSNWEKLLNEALNILKEPSPPSP